MATHPPACAQNCPLESGTGNYLLPVVTQVGWWHPAPSNGTAIPVANFETATSAASWHPGGENSFLKENINACYTKTDPQPRQCCWLVAQNRWLQGPVAVGGGASARSCTMRSNQLADQPQFLWPLHQEVGQAEQAAHRLHLNLHAHRGSIICATCGHCNLFSSQIYTNVKERKN